MLNVILIAFTSHVLLGKSLTEIQEYGKYFFSEKHYFLAQKNLEQDVT
jgi:hypothetical protein